MNDLSSRFLGSAAFRLTDNRLLHPKELPGDIFVALECHILTLNTITLSLFDAIADTNMPQRPAHFQIPLTSVHIVVDYATHELVNLTTVRLTFKDKEEDVVSRNGWTAEKLRCLMSILTILNCT